MAQPEADEVTSLGEPCFGISRGKKFAYIGLDHHGDGWIAIRLDLGDTRWEAADPAAGYSRRVLAAHPKAAAFLSN
jgi:hypothetical protein